MLLFIHQETATKISLIEDETERRCSEIRTSILTASKKQLEEALLRKEREVFQSVRCGVAAARNSASVSLQSHLSHLLCGRLVREFLELFRNTPQEVSQLQAQAQDQLKAEAAFLEEDNLVAVTEGFTKLCDNTPSKRLQQALPWLLPQLKMILASPGHQ